MAIPRPIKFITSQGLVSGVTFIVSMSLLYSSSKEEYASFVLFINGFVLLNSALNATFISPMSVQVPKLSNHQVLIAERYGSKWIVALALVGLPASVLWWTPSADGLVKPWITFPVIVAVGFFLLMRRDLTRNSSLLRGDVDTLLKIDFSYFILGVVGIAGCVFFKRLDFISAMLCFTLPALATGIFKPKWHYPRSEKHSIEINSLDSIFWNDLRKGAFWAVPGILVTWLYSNGYWFLIEQRLGKSSVADLGAYRLLFTPIGLAIQGWMGMVRPLFVNLHHHGKEKEIFHKIIQQGALSVLGVVIFSIAVYGLVVAYPNVLPASFREENSATLILFWGSYFAVFAVRNCLTAATISNTSGFKSAFYVGSVGCVIFYLMVLLGWNHANPLFLCIGSLIAAELLMSVIFFIQLKCSARNMVT